MKDADINSVVETIYETVHADKPWKEMLHRINSVFNIESSSLIFTRRPGSPESNVECHTGVSARFLEFLNCKHSSNDETYLRAINETLDRPFWLSAFASKTKSGNPLKAALNAYGFGDSLLVNFEVDETERGMLVLRGSVNRRDFTPEEANVTSLISPHLRTAFGIRAKLTEAERALARINHALNGFNCGALRIDASARVLEMDERACDTVKSADGIEVRQGHLVVRGGGDSANTLARTLRKDDASPIQTAVSAVKIDRNSGRFYIGVLTQLRRLPGRSSEYFLGLRDPFRNVPCEDLLNSIFGLTKQEARVAWLLGTGLEAANIASLHSVSVNTVRTQRARIYTKIGINCQSELVKIMGALPGTA